MSGFWRLWTFCLVLLAGQAWAAGGPNDELPTRALSSPVSRSAANNYILVTAPAPGSNVSGAVNVISGTAGLGLINAGAYYNGVKLNTTEATPLSCSGNSCTWSLTIDVTSVPAGPQTLQIIGYSNAAGQPGGVQNSINFAVNVTQSGSAAITFIGASLGSNSGSSGADCTPGTPVGTVPGDFELAYVVNQNTAPGNTPAGWALASVAGNQAKAVNTIQSSALYYRVYAAGDSGPQFTNLSFPKCLIRTYRGVSTSTPFDAWAACTATNATSCPISGMPATANGNETIAAFFDFNLGAQTIAGPSGYGNATAEQTQRASWMGDRIIAASGSAVGTITATVSGSSNFWDALAISLIPTGGAPTPQAPQITAQPSPATVTVGQVAQFAAAASGYPAPTWQWQVSTDGGATWASAPGASTSASYTTPTTTNANNGNQYRAVATNASGAATTSAVLLTVNPIATGGAIPCTGNGGTGSGNCGTNTAVAGQAARANDFLNSIGVVIGGTAAGESSTAQRIAMLMYLGARNVKGYSPLGNPASAAVATCQGANVRTVATTGKSWTGSNSTILSSELPFANSIAAVANPAGDSCLLAMEGPSEPDNFCITYNAVVGGGGGTCASANWLPVGQMTRDYFADKNADPILKNYAFFSASHTGSETDNAGVQFLTIPTGAGAELPTGTAFADYANVHNYVNVFPPTLDNRAWKAADGITFNDNAGATTRDQDFFSDFVNTWKNHYAGIPVAGGAAMNAPRVTTETGDGTSHSGGDPNLAVSVFLSQWKWGYKYTFWYQLRDNEGGAANDFGLFAANTDGSGTAKATATELHNLTTILADRANSFTPTTLAYSIASEPANVHDLLLQKGNGNYEIIVWADRPAGSAAQNVTVSLGGSYNGNVYDVAAGTGASSSFTNATTVSLAMTDHAQIIEVTGAGVVSANSCATNGVSALNLPCPNFTPNAVQARQAFNFVNSEGQNAQYAPQGYQAPASPNFSYQQLLYQLNYLSGGDGTTSCPTGPKTACAHGWLRLNEPTLYDAQTTGNPATGFASNDTGFLGSTGLVNAAVATGWTISMGTTWAITNRTVGSPYQPPYDVYSQPWYANWPAKNWTLPLAKSLASQGVLHSFEMSNEVDNFGSYYTPDLTNNFGAYWSTVQTIGSHDCGGSNGDANWDPFPAAANATNGVFKADPVLKNYAIMGPSHTFIECHDVQFGNYGPAYPSTSLHYDVANLHSYESAGQNPNRSWNCASPTITPNDLACDETMYNSHIRPPFNGGPYAGLTNAQALDIANYPRMVTETGVPSLGYGEGGHAFWVLNMYLDHWNRGFSGEANFCLNDLVVGDGGVSTTFGLFDNAGNPKQAATAVHNFNDIIADSTNAFTPGQMHFTLSGCASAPAGSEGTQPLCHGVLLQKSSSAPWGANHYYLAITHEPDFRAPTTDNVLVKFDDVNNGGAGGVYNYVLYDPQTGDHTHTTGSGQASSVTIPMTTDQIVVEIYSSSTLSAPSITTQPTSATASVGQTATFTAGASGNPPPTWQWQLSTDSGATWNNAPGTSTGFSYTTPATTSAMSGYQYRARATNSQGTATSNAAVLTVSAGTVFTVTSPLQNATVSGSAPISVTTDASVINATCWYNGSKVCVDQAPVLIGGVYKISLTLNSNALPNGSQTVLVEGYNSGGTVQAAVNLTLNINNGVVSSSGTFDQFGFPNPPPAPNNQTAVPAIAFLHSLGVNTCGNAGAHCNSGDPAAPPGSGSVATDQAQLQFTGMYYVRPNGGTYDANFVINTIQPIGVKIGWQLDDSPHAGNVVTSDIQNYYIATAKLFANAGVLGWVEGPDEPDNFGWSYNGVPCAGSNAAGVGPWDACAAFQKDVYAAFKADAVLNKYFVSGQSNTGTQHPDCGLEYIVPTGIPASAGTLCGNPPGTVFADGGAYHPYMPGSDTNHPNESWYTATPWQYGLPTSAILAGNEYLAGAARYANGSFAGGLSAAQLQDVIHTIRTTTEWNVPETGAGGSDIVGVHMMNAFIDFFLRGSKVNEVYGMCAPSSVPGMGFYAGGTFCGAAFPAGNYIHSITHFLTDTGDVPAPPTVPWTYSGCPNDTAPGGGEQECHFMLLTKSPSAVWHPNSNVLVGTFEPPCGSSCSYSPINLTINLGSSPFSHVNVYDATTVVSPSQNSPVSPTPIASCSNCSSINITWGAFGHSSGAPPPIFVEFYNDQASFTLTPTGGPTYTFTNPTFRSTFPDGHQKDKIFGNVPTAQTAKCPIVGGVAQGEGCWYSASNYPGDPGYGAVICCGTYLVGVDSTQGNCAAGQPGNSFQPIPGGGIALSWTSGCGIGSMTTVATDGRGFTQRYGYYEITARLAGGPSVWNSFWMLNSTSTPRDWVNKIPGGDPTTNPFENDFFEQYGDSCPFAPGVIWSVHEWPYGGGADQYPGAPASLNFPNPPNYTTQYHKYGVLWDSNMMTYYIDRVQATSMSGQVGQFPVVPSYRDIGYVIINMSMNVCTPFSGAVSPSVMYVKDMTIWQLNQ